MEKLKLVDYESAILRKRTDLKPLSRVYFALPTKPAEQFPYFAQLAVWALQQIGVEMEWSEWDDPTATCSAIYEQLRRLHWPWLQECPPAKLRAGSGDAVVAALDFLLDRVLDARGFRVAAPSYPDGATGSGGDDGAAQADDDEDSDDEIGDETMLDDAPADDDDAYATGGGSGAAGGTADERKGGASGGAAEDEDELAAPAIDPLAWQLELERVGPQLKFRTADVSAQKEWRTHLEQAQRHGEALERDFPSVKAALDKIGSNLRKAADRIAAKERSINKEFEHMAGEFRAKQAQLDAVQEAYNNLTREISDLSADLQEKSDAIDSIKATVSDRNNSMTDVSPLRKLTTTLAQLRKEVQHMELRIGVVAQTLLQAKLKSQSQQHRDRKA